jgi:carbonic anhydrase/acetyltransferase-like protein (isoleucine patch superfamily)
MSPLYTLGGIAPDLPPAGECWTASTAVLIGQVRVKRGASIWFGAVLRADDDVIEIGERSNLQDGCVFHSIRAIRSRSARTARSATG